MRWSWWWICLWWVWKLWIRSLLSSQIYIIYIFLTIFSFSDFNEEEDEDEDEDAEDDEVKDDGKFHPYHPDIDGVLTLPLLMEIAAWRWYRRMRFNPLIVASHVGNARLVHKLLSKGYNPHDTDCKGYSAMWWAKQEGHVDVVVSTLASLLLYSIYSCTLW